MSVTIDSLDLGPAERAVAHERIQRMAYHRWLECAQPDGRSLDCWLAAEREWIHREYVPSRQLDASRPAILDGRTGDKQRWRRNRR